MTAPVGPSLPGPGPGPGVPTPSTPPKRPPGVGFWLGLVVLVAGLVVAVLGVRAAVASYQRDQDISGYAEASTKGHYTAKVGAEAVAAGQQLLTLDQQDLAGARDAQQALAAQRTSDFNAKRAELNTRNAQQSLQENRLADLDQELRRALAKTGALGQRTTTTTIVVPTVTLPPSITLPPS
ncbi:MAG: hypothetical protein R2726_12710 [Acidimicrobiales bacterium]